jgi:hypothetical protein
MDTPPSRRRRSTLIATAVFALAMIAPASALAAYGAIAINPRTSQFGVGYNYPTRHDAKARAKRECPGQCKVVVLVRNLCGATVENDVGFYSGFGTTKQKAYKAAARKAHGHSVHIAWVCSG